MRRSSLGAFVVLVLFAGCAGAPESSTSRTPAAPPGHVAEGGFVDGGVIEGFVLNDEALPVAGAGVGLVGTPLSASANASGGFRFTDLAPGAYQVFVQALGYAVASKTVDVLAGEATPVVFQLRAERINVAFHEVFGPFRGYFECQASLGVAGQPLSYGDCVGVGRLPYQSPNDKTTFFFTLTGDDVQSLIAEARWQRASAATGDKMYFEFDYSTQEHDYNPVCWGDGPSPVFLRWEAPENGNEPLCDKRYFPEGPDIKANRTLYVVGSVPWAEVEVLYQQHFDVMVAAWYVEPAPKEVELFPDQ